MSTTLPRCAKRLGAGLCIEKRGVHFFCARSQKKYKMPPKKLKVEPVDWLESVMDVLLASGGDMAESELYNQTRTQPTEQTESLIIEHPSLYVRGGRVTFRPFCTVQNQEQLLAMFRQTFPRAYRRVDLRGIYPFVNVDINELLFTGRCVVIDTNTDAICATPPRTEVHEKLVDLWNTVDVPLEDPRQKK